jgi:hypothetical protein
MQDVVNPQGKNVEYGEEARVGDQECAGLHQYLTHIED